MVETSVSGAEEKDPYDELEILIAAEEETSPCGVETWAGVGERVLAYEVDSACLERSYVVRLAVANGTFSSCHRNLGFSYT